MTAISCLWCHKLAGISAEDAFRVDTIGAYPPVEWPEGWVIETKVVPIANNLSIYTSMTYLTYYGIWCSEEHRDLWKAEHEDFNDAAKHTGLVK